jgi:hypothetical protein
MDVLESAFNGLHELLRQEGTILSEREKFILMKKVDLDDITKIDISEEDKELLADLYTNIFNGFFKCAADGYEFTPENRINKWFGGISLKENYPDPSEAFIRFAKTYWTFKRIWRDLSEGYNNLIIFKLLSKLEIDIATVFFPTPGPWTIPVEKREQAQRQLILESGANIDVDEFISGNPILRYYKSTKRSGCLGVILTIAIFIVAIIGYLF